MPPVTGTDNGTAGYGVFGKSSNRDGVRGSAPSGAGVHGITNTGIGVYAETNSGFGVFAQSYSDGYGVRGGSNRGDAVLGQSDRGIAVHAESVFGIAVYAKTYGSGDSVHGIADSGNGVVGESNSRSGVVGGSRSGHGVVGESNSGNGVRGFSDGGSGVVGVCNGTGTALWGISLEGAGVDAESFGWHALYAKAWNESYASGYFDGNVIVTGNLQKGGGGFKIDHPVDSANKYLSHSFVESPDMKNLYDGVVSLDKNGEAEIELPDWFAALNNDFRYQLTAISSPGPNLHIAQQISYTTRNDTNSNRAKKTNKSSFKIAGGTSGMKVSWQVTGIRKDPWAKAHRIKVEETKPAKERGYYLYPHLYGKPEKRAVSQLLFPEEKRKLLINETKQHKRLKPIRLKKPITHDISRK
jgi:hypothetical protein